MPAPLRPLGEVLTRSYEPTACVSANECLSDDNNILSDRINTTNHLILNHLIRNAQAQAQAVESRLPPVRV